jgi:hypothetical protein
MVAGTLSSVVTAATSKSISSREIPNSLPSGAHSEYGIGGPLVSGCNGSCTTTVCASQAYCCQTSWDQLCVDTAKTQCDVAVP